jgi:hypothetical protein
MTHFQLTICAPYYFLLFEFVSRSGNLFLVYFLADEAAQIALHLQQKSSYAATK